MLGLRRYYGDRSYSVHQKWKVAIQSDSDHQHSDMVAGAIPRVDFLRLRLSPLSSIHRG